MDDYLIKFLIDIEAKDKYINLGLDKICYLYRPGLPGSVTDQITHYEMLCRDIFIDVEVLKYMDRRHGIDKYISTYKNINRKLFSIMFLLLMKYDKYNIRKREWDILLGYRQYLMNIIGDVSDCDYITDSSKFISYRNYILKVGDGQESNDLVKDLHIDINTVENMYQTYLSDEKTIFNCPYEELEAMLKGE